MGELQAADLDRDRDRAGAVSGADRGPGPEDRPGEGGPAADAGRRAAPAGTLTRAEYAELMRRTTPAVRVY
jgi:hypothetical protein